MSNWFELDELEEELEFSEISEEIDLSGHLREIEIIGEAYEIVLEKINTRLLLTADPNILKPYGVFEVNSYWLLPEIIPFPYRKIQELSKKCGIVKVEGKVKVSENTIEREKFLELIELEINTL